MTPTALSWFYTSPGNDALQIAERVRLTLWDARIANVWLDVVSASEPYKMAGVHNGAPIDIEWVPGEWLRLRARPDAPDVVDGMSFVLVMKPALKYVDADEYMVWEWHTSDIDRRWNEVSGNPAYQRPERFQ